MTWAVSLTSAARVDIIEAFEWYEARAAGLGALFIAEIDRQMGRIGEGPQQFPIVIANVRRARLRRFPYGLFFRIDGNVVTVIACFHASRDPRRWDGRS